MRTFLLGIAALALWASLAQAEEPSLYYRDYGWRVRSRSGETWERHGFSVRGTGVSGIMQSQNLAADRTRLLDRDYNAAVDMLGEAGHGVAYMPVYIYEREPVYVPAPRMRVVRYYYDPWP